MAPPRLQASCRAQRASERAPWSLRPTGQRAGCPAQRQGGGAAPCGPEEEEAGSLMGSGGAVAPCPVSPSWGSTRRQEARSFTGWVTPMARPGALGTPKASA